MIQRIFVTGAALVMCAAAGGAFAADDGFYLGASLGQSDSGLRSGTVNYSDNDLGWKAIAGFRAFKLLAVEANYVDLGNTKSSGVQARTKALDAFVMGFLPVPFVDIYGKLGVVSWKTDASTTSINAPGSSGFSFSHNGGDLAYGAGVQMHLGAVAARLEYEGFDIQQASHPALLSLGLTYTF
jgi:OmpA-like transmembrane domain